MARKSAASAADRDEMIRWLFENSRDLMHVIGADGCFKLTNAAWKQLTGWEERDLVGARALDFFHEADIELVRVRVRECRFCKNAACTALRMRVKLSART